MGKRVFEVAKDLGVDHRDLLKRCDDLRIEVRNYMSQLTTAQEAKLRSAFEAERGQAQVEEKVQAPGVRRRRRPGSRGDEKPAVRPATLASPQPSAPTPPAAEAPPVRRKPAEAPAPAAEPEAPAAEAPAEAKPEAAPTAPAAEEKPPPPSPRPRRPTCSRRRPRPSRSRPNRSRPRRPPPRRSRPRRPPPRRSRPRRPPPRRSRPRRPPPRRSRPRPRSPRPRSPRPRSPRPRSPRPARAPSPPGAAPIRSRRGRATRASATSARPGRPPCASRSPARARRPPRCSGASRSSSCRAARGVRRPAAVPARARPRSVGRRRAVAARRGPPRGPGGPSVPAPGAVPLPGRDPGRRRKGAPGRPGSDADRQRTQRTQRSRRQVFNREDIYQGAARAGRGRKRKMSSRKGAKTQLTTPAAHKRVVRVDGTISVGQLGQEMGVKTNELIRKLMGMGVMATMNQQIDVDTASLLATEYDYEVKNVEFDEDAVLSGPADAQKVEADPDAVLRAPVVTVMGHVDHGKTTLLDRIRKANVASGEAGGITQHIGAYKVQVGDGKSVVFLDTPGHAAFTAMRARGASVTDLVVLIVAADDGVMPQTVESINHAKAAGVPLVVAINKIDKPGVDPERIKQELTKYEVVPEEWGGDTMCVPVSALSGQGIDELLENLALQAEILELKANPKKEAYGRVVEARVEKGRGPVCTVLVQEGTLKQGDYIVSGDHYGRVRAMLDHTGQRLKEAGPATPVEVQGLNGVPSAGDGFHVVKNEKDAKRVVSSRTDRARAQRSSTQGANAADLLANMGKVDKEVQNLILKTDVAGSYEAIRHSLEELGNDEVEVKIVHGGVGVISESDVTLATASEAKIIGFNVGPDTNAKRAADQGGVEILRFSVIYDVLDTVRDMLSGLLTPETVEEHLGKVEVRAVFHIQKVGAVAGSFVTEGKVVRGAHARVFRDGKLVGQGRISTLKRFKDDVREVATGYECGLSVDGYKDVQEGDTIEVFDLKLVKRKIDD
ncbi:MAG: translation initiation factor IF-2 [Myxococcales bacterium]|nr:translation initiation factor IF-2 [Myxococcales bacterium]